MSRENTIKYFFAPILGGIITILINTFGNTMTTYLAILSFFTGYLVVGLGNFCASLIDYTFFQTKKEKN